MIRPSIKEKPANVTAPLANFWDQRFTKEGAIWGNGPSPTAQLVQSTTSPESSILDVGFGYGRDMAYLMKQGHRVSGVDLSHVGQEHARARFLEDNVQPEKLILAEYNEQVFPPESFDVILSHRVAHLLTSEEAIGQFAKATQWLLKPGGLFCLGVRDTRDLNPEAMNRVGQDIYEYKDRPGHRIRYWDEAGFRRVFGERFDILSLTSACEPECSERPVSCHLTIMTARKN